MKLSILVMSIPLYSASVVAANGAMIDSFWGSLVVAILGGFVGGIVGGLFALLGVFVNDWLKNRREKEEIKSVLKAIYCEAETFWSIYEEKIGKNIESFMSEEELFFPLQSVDWFDNSFPVYDNNSSKISSVREETYKDIVRFYMYARDIITTLREYRIKLDRLNEVDWAYSDTKINQPGVTDTKTNNTEENWFNIPRTKSDIDEILKIIGKGGLEGQRMYLKINVIEISHILGNRHKQFKKATEQLLKDLKLEFEK